MLITGWATMLACVFFFVYRKKTIALFLLVATAFIFRILMAQLDPFLHAWDEQYHALVAKNMVEHPFKPMLYADPVLDYNYQHWWGNHIWVHKQPVPLWQIALSFKIFGVSELSLRLPTIIMSTLLVLVVFRIGKVTMNENTGFLAALICTLNCYQLEYCAGNKGMDHVDTTFLFYVTLSIWAWVELQRSGKQKWLIWIVRTM